MIGELHPNKNHLRGGLRHLVRSFLHVDDSVEGLDLCSSVAGSRERNGHLPCHCLVGARQRTRYVVLSSLLCQGKVLQPALYQV